MKAKPGTASCPHCGGRNGFFTNIVLQAERSYSWDGEEVDTENYTQKSEANPRCSDCGKSVRSAIAHGVEGPRKGNAPAEAGASVTAPHRTDPVEALLRTEVNVHPADTDGVSVPDGEPRQPPTTRS